MPAKILTLKKDFILKAFKVLSGGTAYRYDLMCGHFPT